MELGRSLSRYLRYCATDLAFDRLAAAAEAIEKHPVWGALLDVLPLLEREIAADATFEQVDSSVKQNRAFEELEHMDAYWRTSARKGQVEDLCGAFAVVLQTRLTALRSAADGVFAAAREQDKIDIAKRHIATEHSQLVRRVWELGNYVKHHDEWSAANLPRKSTLQALVDLGVAESEKATACYLVDHVATACVLRLGGEPTVLHSMERIVEFCRDHASRCLDEICAALDDHADAVHACREATRERLKPQLNMKPEEDA